MAHWFIRGEDEAEVGPVSPSELLGMVREGRVVATTVVRKDDSAWFPAADVGGLFEAARRPTIEHYCTRCGARVGPPPVTCGKCDADLSQTRQKIIEHSVAGDPQKKADDSGKAGSSAKSWLNRRLGRG